MSINMVYNRKELCEVMGCGFKRARRILDENGVKPIDYGPGRSGGLRWLVDDVTRCLHTINDRTALNSEAPTKRTRHDHRVLNVPIDDLYRSLYKPEDQPLQ